jgi:hypothetical protein
MDQIYLAQEMRNLVWFFEHGRGTSSFIKCGQFFYWPKNYLCLHGGR